MTEVKLHMLKVRQPIGDFFVGKIDHRLLLKVSASDIRHIADDVLGDYVGIQRRLDPSRIRELRTYVASYDATFPTAIILAVDDDNAHYDEATSELIIHDNSVNGDLSQVAIIIDGQHRIEGLKYFTGDVFEVPVCIFVGADMPTKAVIFATVNLAQTKVNRSLVYDLLDYEKQDSPQKVAHNIAVNLDLMEESPFRGRIKRLGVATEGRERETLTQATVVEALISLMSKDVVRDRNSLFGLVNRSSLSDSEDDSYPFRYLYRQHLDSEILANVINYFKAVSERYVDSWSAVARKGNVLPKTNGFKALMHALGDIYPRMRESEGGSVVSVSKYREFVDLVEIDDGDFTINTFPPGSSGESILYNYLRNAASQLESA